MKKTFAILTLSILLTVMALPLAAPVVKADIGQPGEYCTSHSDYTVTFSNNSGPASSHDITSGQNICPLDGAKDADGNAVSCDWNTDAWAMVCMLNTIYSITKWLFWILMAVSVIMIILGAFIFMTSQGNPDKAKSGKNIIIYAVIGVVLALLAKFFPALARFFVGM